MIMTKPQTWVLGACVVVSGVILARTAIGAALIDAETWQPFSRNVITTDDTIRRTLRFGQDADRELEIRAINGSIQVIGVDTADVQLEARKRVRARSEADARDAQTAVTLEISEESHRITAVVREQGMSACGERGSPHDWRDHDYEVTFDFVVRVPRGTRLELCTINGGEVKVEQTNGDFDVRNVNGAIAMNGIGGSGRAVTVNGAVDVTFREAPAAASEFRTVNGDVAVTAPAGLSAELKMKTFNGGLYTDFDVEVLPRSLDPVRRRDRMSVYRSNDFTRARVGAGGPELTFETLNGDVRLRASR